MVNQESEDRGVWYYVTHPWVAVGMIAATLGGGFDPLIQLVAGTIPLVYPVISTLTGVAGLVPAIPTGIVQQVFIIVALGYVGILAADALNRLKQRYS